MHAFRCAGTLPVHPLQWVLGLLGPGVGHRGSQRGLQLDGRPRRDELQRLPLRAAADGHVARGRPRLVLGHPGAAAPDGAGRGLAGRECRAPADISAGAALPTGRPGGVAPPGRELHSVRRARRQPGHPRLPVAEDAAPVRPRGEGGAQPDEAALRHLAESQQACSRWLRWQGRPGHDKAWESAGGRQLRRRRGSAPSGAGTH
mmetsp:Transcript_86422/g.245006  ORF Transcript_86422/g.245006 Transcript_86422/m.245006 type:complete len:203 (+) Transcript_86422:917-1525(+)